VEIAEAHVRKKRVETDTRRGQANNEPATNVFVTLLKKCHSNTPPPV